MRMGLILAGALAVLTACASPPPPVETAGPAMAEPTDAASCKAAGGDWHPVGLLQAEACEIPYPDAGKVCTDNDQCAGQCWAEGVSPFEEAGQKGTGRCQPTNMPFGCHSDLVGGIVQPGLCVD